MRQGTRENTIFKLSKPRPRGLYKYKLGVPIQETEPIKVATVTQIIPFINIKNENRS